MAKKYYLWAVALFATLGLSSCNIADILDELDDDDEFLIEKSHGDKHSEAEKVAKEYLGSYPCELGITFFDYHTFNGQMHFSGLKDNHLWMSSYAVEDKSLYNTWTSDREFRAEQFYIDDNGSHEYFRVKSIKPFNASLVIAWENGTRELFTFRLTTKSGEDFFKTIYVDNVQGHAFETDPTTKYEGRNRFSNFPVIYDKMYDLNGNVMYWFSEFGVGLPLNDGQETCAELTYTSTEIWALKSFRYVDGHGLKIDYMADTVIWDVDLSALFPDAESISCESIAQWIKYKGWECYKLKVKQEGKTVKKYVYLDIESGELRLIETLY